MGILEPLGRLGHLRQLEVNCPNSGSLIVLPTTEWNCGRAQKCFWNCSIVCFCSNLSLKFYLFVLFNPGDRHLLSWQAYILSTRSLIAISFSWRVILKKHTSCLREASVHYRDESMCITETEIADHSKEYTMLLLLYYTINHRFAWWPSWVLSMSKWPWSTRFIRSFFQT